MPSVSEFRIETDGPALQSRGRYGAGEAQYPGHRDARARRSMHACSCLGAVVAGGFDFATPAGAATATPGTIIFGNAREQFTYRYLAASGARRAVVAFSQDLLEEATDGASERPFDVAALPAGRATVPLYALIRRIARAEGPVEDDVAELIVMALTVARRTTMSRTTSAERRRVLEVVRHLDRDYSRPWTLADMATLACLSKFHFLRVFRSTTGENPRRYLVAARLRAAIDRLVDTSEPITSVALGVGFNDISHFNATFRAAFGRSPRAWRATACTQPDSASLRHSAAVASSAGKVHSIRSSSIVTSRGVPNVVMVEKKRSS